jgi:hypothetical protein
MAPTASAFITESTLLNSTIATASFSKLSPSTKTDSRPGAFKSLKSAMTATGSLAEISAPKSGAAPQESGVSAPTTPPTMTVERITPGPARRRMGERFCLTSRRSSCTAAGNTRVGRKKYRTTSGRSRMCWMGVST